jgi:hypothetical protein
VTLRKKDIDFINGLSVFTYLTSIKEHNFKLNRRLFFKDLGEFPALHPCKAVISATSHNSGWHAALRAHFVPRGARPRGTFKGRRFRATSANSVAYAPLLRVAANVICHCTNNYEYYFKWPLFEVNELLYLAKIMREN